MSTLPAGRTLRAAVVALAVVAVAALAAPAHAENIFYNFTYQGSLSDNGIPAVGLYDLRFTIFDAVSGGSQVVGYNSFEDVSVVQGVFTVELSWSRIPWETAEARYLQVEVRPGASTGGYTILPRQRINPTPLAIGLSLPHFQSLNSASSLLSTYNDGAGAGGEFSSAGTRGLIGRTTGTSFNAAGVRGEATGSSGNVIGVEGVAQTSAAGTGVVGRGYATGAYIEGTGPASTGVYANGWGLGLRAENWGTGPAIYAVGKGQTASNATLQVSNTQTSQGMCTYMYNNSNFATAHLRNSGSGEILWLDHQGTGNYIVAQGPTGWKFWVDNAGVTHTKVLEILGGADLAERFDVAGDDAAIEPGMVVSIDPTHEGRLVRSCEPYDHRVAGIVSGAGDVAPGMLMGQKGSVADGEHPIALTGRVYCRATAANGPIRPGDLLTTSGVAGYAMRVDDPSRAQGAILGKAMGSLDSGEGLVLVLVGLQ